MRYTGAAVFVIVVLSGCAAEQRERSPTIADWELAPGQELAAGTRSIEILVHERDCASGDTAEGRIETDINYRTEANRRDGPRAT